MWFLLCVGAKLSPYHFIKYKKKTKTFVKQRKARYKKNQVKAERIKLLRVLNGYF